MSAPDQFDILVRRRIPYLSVGLSLIVFSLLLILFLLYLLMCPVKNAPGEMAVAYYLLVVPGWLRIMAVVSLAGVFVLTPIYFRARLKKPALLKLNDDAISITGKQLNLSIPFKGVKQIYFNDLQTSSGQLKHKFQIVIKEKSDRTIVFMLANYDDNEKALETLGKINNVEFAFYEMGMPTMHFDE